VHPESRRNEAVYILFSQEKLVEQCAWFGFFGFPLSPIFLSRFCDLQHIIRSLQMFLVSIGGDVFGLFPVFGGHAFLDVIPSRSHSVFIICIHICVLPQRTCEYTRES